ncbi:MAG: MOSC domain-containing protein [Gemmatimonadetes bacterium]|nr:MOSC domain-containing protein [Gemmatimonadota bacterium]
MNGRILAIHIAAEEGGAPQPVPQVRVVEGSGLEGDRYTRLDGAEPKEQVTFIEREALDALHADYGIQLGAAESRRNILTEGVALNHLVGREFRAGDCRFIGRELCEPCGYLEKQTQRGVIKGLIHRGGLRAEILQGGTLRPGDAVEPA